MGQTIRVPDPVYERAEREAERQDVALGTIVRDWMDKAEQFDELSEAVR